MLPLCCYLGTEAACTSSPAGDRTVPQALHRLKPGAPETQRSQGLNQNAQ